MSLFASEATTVKPPAFLSQHLWRKYNTPREAIFVLHFHYYYTTARFRGRRFADQIKYSEIYGTRVYPTLIKIYVGETLIYEELMISEVDCK